MIKRDELEAKALEFAIPIASLERDYVLGWLIFAIFTQTELKDILFLKGGNALRKCYFPNTRYSYDVDFGTPWDIDPEKLRVEMIKACDFVSKCAAIIFRNDEVRVDEKFGVTSQESGKQLRVFEIRIYFQDFYSNADHIRIKVAMDLTRFDRTILPVETLPLLHPYSDAEDLNGVVVRCMKAEEILATKLKCILQREHAPDLFDVVYPEVFPLGQQLDKKEIVRTFLRKTIFEPNPVVVKKILLNTSFEFFRQFWKKTVICAQKAFFDVESAIQKFNGLLGEIFADYGERPWVDNRFFGPELRQPILKAARTQTLLRMRYAGYDRVIEPYSLKYMEQRSGEAREYLYLWNRSGGSQSTPGIRMFLADRVQSVENTEENFVPRFPIELSRAGEAVDNRLLYDPSKPERSVTRARSARDVGPRYVFRCGACGKRFYKSSYDSSINSHKNKSGLSCYGSFGQYVKTIHS